MNKLCIKYNPEDSDNEGNIFPSITVKTSETETKKFFHQDLPILSGIGNNTEMTGFDDSLNKAKTFVTDISFYQNWLMFSDEYVYLWLNKIPAEIDINNPDIEVPISHIINSNLELPI